MAISNEVLKLISYICFGAGGVSAIATIILFIVPNKKSKKSADVLIVENDITSLNTDTIIE